MKAPVKFAVVGCGHIGKRHAAMIQAAPEAQLVAVVDNAWSKEDLDDTSTRIMGGGRDGAHQLCPMPFRPKNVDVVAVATPNGSHVELACAGHRCGLSCGLGKTHGPQFFVS